MRVHGEINVCNRRQRILSIVQSMVQSTVHSPGFEVSPKVVYLHQSHFLFMFVYILTCSKIKNENQKKMQDQGITGPSFPVNYAICVHYIHSSYPLLQCDSNSLFPVGILYYCQFLQQFGSSNVTGTPT